MPPGKFLKIQAKKTEKAEFGDISGTKILG